MIILKNVYIRISINFRFSTVVVRVCSFLLCFVYYIWCGMVSFFEVPSLNFQKLKESHAALNIIHKPYKRTYELSLQQMKT